MIEVGRAVIHVQREGEYAAYELSKTAGNGSSIKWRRTMLLNDVVDKEVDSEVFRRTRTLCNYGINGLGIMSTAGRVSKAM